MAIIGEAEGKRPTLAKSAENDRALFDLLKGIVTDLLTDGKLSSALLEWFQDWFAPYKKEHEFRSWGEYWDYIRRHDIRSLKGETVKSYEECEIANFLYLHGVAYEYEALYQHDTATAEKRQYQPDFYLTEAGVYIEHFGLDSYGNTASFVDREKYLQEMEWKRQIHAEHGTVLIETFSHERADGTLIQQVDREIDGARRDAFARFLETRYSLSSKGRAVSIPSRACWRRSCSISKAAVCLSVTCPRKPTPFRMGDGPRCSCPFFGPSTSAIRKRCPRQKKSTSTT